MERKVVSGIILALVLICILTLAFDIQRVKAYETIYIRGDGSVEPPTAPISRDGDIYTFTANIYDEIVVERDNVILDGNGYTVQGSGYGDGIQLHFRTGVTIKNTIVKGFTKGIALLSSHENVIFNNTISSNELAGLHLTNSSHSNILDNLIEYNGLDGLLIGHGSSHNLAINNKAGYNGVHHGICIWDKAFSNALINNTSYHNGGCGLFVGNYSFKNVLRGNNVTSNYAEGINLSYSYNNTVVGNTATSNANDGILLYRSPSNMISGNRVSSNNQTGIRLDNCTSTQVADNVAILNYGAGIQLLGSNNTVMNNNASLNNNVGIAVLWSSHTIVTKNNVTRNRSSASPEYTPGIHIQGSTNNLVTRNDISNNGLGIHLIENCNDNVISGNAIAYSSNQGIYLDSSCVNNRIFHNNFNENGLQAVDEASNIWDSGGEGNYWSDYTGSDLDGDGIGDTPYLIDSDSRDNHPLVRRDHDGDYTGNVTWVNYLGNVTRVNYIHFANFIYGDKPVNYLNLFQDIRYLENFIFRYGATVNLTVTVPFDIAWTVPPYAQPNGEFQTSITVKSVPDQAQIRVSMYFFVEVIDSRTDQVVYIGDIPLSCHQPLDETFNFTAVIGTWRREYPWTPSVLAEVFPFHYEILMIPVDVDCEMILTPWITITGNVTSPANALATTSDLAEIVSPKTGRLEWVNDGDMEDVTINVQPEATEDDTVSIQLSEITYSITGRVGVDFYYKAEAKVTLLGVEKPYTVGDETKHYELPLPVAIIDLAATLECPQVKIDATPPTISSVQISPTEPIEIEPTEVVCTVEDAKSGVSAATLHYSTDGGTTWTTIEMKASSNNSTYSSTILAQPPDTKVLCYVTATDVVGNIARNDNQGQYYSFTVQPAHEGIPLWILGAIIAAIATITVLAAVVYRVKKRARTDLSSV